MKKTDGNVERSEFRQRILAKSIRSTSSRVKVTPPKVSGVVHRERLFRLVDTYRESPLVWISAPAGSGKTTLVADYLCEKKLPCIWYRMDEGDADIATFFYYMGIAAKKAAPRHSLPLLTTEYLPGLPAFTLRYFELLYGRLKKPAVLVFENYQCVPRESGLHEVIRRGAEVLPEGLNMIIISRDPPPPPFSRFMLNGTLRHLRPDEINFTPEELSSLLASKCAAKPDGEILAEIHARTRGWAAGIVLMAEMVGRKWLDERRNDFRAPQELFDYFASEVFVTATPAIQEFLQKTAFAPRMTARTAERLTANGSAGEILSRLHQKHYFTEKNAQPEPIYQYHPLFREFLVSKARENFAPHELAEIVLKTVTLLMEDGEVELCASLLREAREWQRLVSLILENAPELISQGRDGILVEWIDWLPAGIVKQNPDLLCWKGKSVCSHDTSLGRSMLIHAFTIFEKEGNDAAALAVWPFIVDAFMVEFGCTKELDPWVDWLDERDGKGLVFPSSDMERTVVSSMTAALVWRMPNHPMLDTWLRRMFAQLHKSPDAGCMYRYASIASFYLFMGKRTECSALFDGMKKLEAKTPVMKLILKLAEMTTFSASSDTLDKAVRAFSEGRELAREAGVHVLDMAYFCMGMLTLLFSGDMKRAGDLVSEYENTQGLPLLQTSQVSFFSAWYHLLAGEFTRALILARHAAETADTPGHVLYQAFAGLLLAEALHLNGEHQDAESWLASAGHIAHGTGAPSCIFMYYMMESSIAFERNDSAVGLDYVRTAMALGKQTGYSTYLFMWRKDRLRYLCVKALENGIETDFVSELVRKNGFSPDMVPIEIREWPWPVKIVTLGRFGLDLDKRTVSCSGKQQKKPLLLLKVLTALGGGSVEKERLSDLLWPEADGDQAHSSFTTTVMRLRRLLGHEETIKVRNGRVSLDTGRCWVDAWAFELSADRAHAHVKNLLRDLKRGRRLDGEIMNTVEKTIHSYSGPFLEEEGNQPWLLPLRRRLERTFTDLVIGFGKCLEAEDQWEKAVDYFNMALDRGENACEELYRRLMICYCHLGQPARAAEVYQSCRKALAVGFGLKPSRKIESLYKELML